MALTVLTPASTRRLITLEHLEDDLGTDVVQAKPDAFLRLIDRASKVVEAFCDRILAQQKYRETFYAARDCYIFLRHTPVVSVTAVTGDGNPFTLWTLENAEAGILSSPRGWGWGTGLVTWSTDGMPFQWTVDYVAGYILPEQTTPPDATGARLPADYEAATLEAVKVWQHEALPGSRVTRRDWEDQAISYSVQAGRYGLPVMAQKLLLDNGRRRVAIR